MNLPGYSIRRPVTILMFAAGIVLLGTISWSRLPQELFPPITYPQITVVTSYENAAPEEIEALITRPIEESVSAASNIRKVSSTSREGTSLVFCEFNWNTNMDFAALNVREKIDLIKERLPREAQEPIVMKYNPFDMPIMMVSVTSAGDYIPSHELRELSRRIIKDELEKISGVAQILLTGGREREILVELNQDRLRAFTVSIMDVIELLRQANLNYPAGTIETSFYEYLVRTIGEFKTIREMDDLPLLVEERQTEEEYMANPLTEAQRERLKRVIYLRELGTVKDTLKDQTSISRFNGRDNISLSVQRQADANTLEVCRQVYDRLKTLRLSLPPEIEIEVVYDQSIFISQSINELRNNALQGGVLAFLVLLLFLRNVRSAFVATIGIPIAILFTLVLMYFGKLTMNMMSLGGLALGVGMLVDNGIVVIENIFRHRQMGKEAFPAAEEASNEVLTAIVGSTLTTISVFLPLIFVIGIAGQLFKELALTITFSLVASVLISLTLIPLFMSRGKFKARTRGKTEEERLEAFARNTVAENSPRRHRLAFLLITVILGGTIAMALFSFRMLRSLDQEFLPKLDQRQFMIKLEMPPGSALSVTDAVVRRVEGVIGRFSQVQDINVTIGSSKETTMAGAVEVMGVHQSQIMVNLKPFEGRSWFSPGKRAKSPATLSTTEFVQLVKDALVEENLQDADLEYVLQESVFKSVFAGSAPLVIQLQGFDMEHIMIPAAREIERRLAQVPGVYGIQNTISSPSPEVKIRVLKDRAALYQLTVNQIASIAQAAVRGYVASKFKEEGREIDIRVRLREEDRRDVRKIEKLYVFSPLGVTVFLDQVAALVRGLGPTEIRRENKQRILLVSANLFRRGLNEVVGDVEKILADIRAELPQNYTVEIGGENKEMEESFTSMQFALLLALALVYMIMASEFESLLQPFIIMLTVPLSLIGVTWMLFFTSTPLSVVVALGVMMLGGIAVNNGILLIDFINLARRKGLSIIDAAVQAARVRVRPILMTSLTTVFGLLPLAMALGEGAELRAPMARTVMGGLISATFLTLFVVPSAYIVLETLRGKMVAFFGLTGAEKEEVILIKPQNVIIQEIEIGDAPRRGDRRQSGRRGPERPASADTRGDVTPVPDAPVHGPEEDSRSAPQPPQGPELAPEQPLTKDQAERQTAVRDHIHHHGRITRLEYVIKFKVPLPVAEHELEAMVKKGELKASGEGPHRMYVLPERKPT